MPTSISRVHHSVLFLVSAVATATPLPCPPGGIVSTVRLSEPYENSTNCAIVPPRGRVVITLVGSLTNQLGATLNNGGVLNNDGGILENVGRRSLLANVSVPGSAFGALLVNENTARLINEATLNNGGGAILRNRVLSTIENKGTILNSGAQTLLSNETGSTLANTGSLTNTRGATVTNSLISELRNSGTLWNTGVGTNLINGSASTVSNTGSLFNTFSASITNEFLGSSIVNGGFFYNRQGATLRNQNFALFTNRAGGTVQNSAGGVIFVQSGARLINTDAATRFFNFGQAQVVNSSRIANQSGASFTNTGRGTLLDNQSNGILENTGTGTRLVNQSGATLRNRGTLLNTDGAMLVNAVGSVLQNDPGATVRNTGSGTQLVNTGQLVDQGTIINDAVISNQNRFFVPAGGTLSGSGSYIQQSVGGLNAETQVGGTLSQGFTNLRDGVLRGAGVVQGPLLNGANAIVRGDGDGITLAGSVSGKGAYAGTVKFAGGLSPGDSPALVMGEHLVFEATNVLEIELGGLARGIEYDAIDADSVELGGNLDVGLIDRFYPAKDQTFDILEASDFLGDFREFVLPPLAAGLVWNHSIIDFGNGLEVYQLRVATAPTPNTLALLLIGTAGLAVTARRWRSKPAP